MYLAADKFHDDAFLYFWCMNFAQVAGIIRNIFLKTFFEIKNKKVFDTFVFMDLVLSLSLPVHQKRVPCLIRKLELILLLRH